MCTVSMVMDQYRERWQPLVPQPVFIPLPVPPAAPLITPDEVAEFQRLLARAREYDKKNNEPDCELQEKKDALLAIAEKLGIKISFEEPAASQ